MKINKLIVNKQKVMSILLTVGIILSSKCGSIQGEVVIPNSSEEIISGEDVSRINREIVYDGNTYKRYNSETNEYSAISIFDDENIKSKQYGASQLDFKTRFNTLINDPLIWDEMQKYFPYTEFGGMDQAMIFYRKYFTLFMDVVVDIQLQLIVSLGFLRERKIYSIRLLDILCIRYLMMVILILIMKYWNCNFLIII